MKKEEKLIKNIRITDVKNPKYCKIIRKVELHSAKSDRSCLHVEVELPQGMKFVFLQFIQYLYQFLFTL